MHDESIKKKAIIVGAGPAGLTAAFELLKNTNIHPIVFEKSEHIGGISKTLNYKGNRIDLGGHRFFSKSDRVMNWWLEIMPLQTSPSKDEILFNSFSKHNKSSNNYTDPEISDKVMLVRKRLSRIYFLRKFFDYPISLNFKTLTNLGFIKIVKISFYYLKILLFPIKHEKSLEDFFINRFGKELYKIFFKDYTKKVWGVDCQEIKPEWGAQRVKGLSISKAIIHSFKNIFKKKTSIEQKNTETSLIEKFLYPKLGPGQLWEEVANSIKINGGEIFTKHLLVGIHKKENFIVRVDVKNLETGEVFAVEGNYIFSSMPVKDLIGAFKNSVPAKVNEIAIGLVYRDYISVGLLLDKMKIKNNTKIKTINNIVPDNWIYIQERDVKVGRLQIFNNWSPYLVKNLNKIWVGLEYFCNEGDEIWTKPDNDMGKFAIEELCKIDIIDKNDVLDFTVIRMEKTYPAYFGTYDEFDMVRNFTDTIENLFLIGRNGMHRYNNMDHSMLTAMIAVENIVNGVKSKDNIWGVNAEEDYHEEK